MQSLFNTFPELLKVLLTHLFCTRELEAGAKLTFCRKLCTIQLISNTLITKASPLISISIKRITDCEKCLNQAPLVDDLACKGVAEWTRTSEGPGDTFSVVALHRCIAVSSTEVCCMMSAHI